MDSLVIIYFCLFFSFCVCQDTPCSKELAIDITDGVKNSRGIITKNGVDFNENNYFQDGGRTLGCICNIKNCIRKCCNENQLMVNKTCSNRHGEPFSPTIYHNMIPSQLTISDYFITIGRGCPYSYLPIQGEIAKDIFLQENGSLFYSEWDGLYELEYYCIDNFIKKTNDILVLLCEYVDSPDTEMQKNINGIGMIISMPFLLVTFVVYLLLPERNLHRRALMSYVFALLAAYISLVVIQLNPEQFSETPCKLLGYMIIFFFLVSFFWMNVMCVDMWLAFSGMRTFLTKKTAERKRFIIYCIYAWGMPIIHVLIVLLLSIYGDQSSKYHPQIGVRRCFLGEGMPTFYYFYLPMAVLIGINIFLFAFTTIRIQRIKKETAMLKHTDSKRHSYEDDKQKFNLYLKLMFAMGVNWIMELVSWAVDYLVADAPSFVWYLTDFTNAMYGVLIFMIFVFKKKIWRSLKKRYYICIGKPHLAHSMTTSSARGTRTSNYSTTDTGVSNDHRLSDMRNGKNAEESALNRA